MTSFKIDDCGRLMIQAPNPAAAIPSTSSNISFGRSVTTQFTDSARNIGLTEKILQPQPQAYTDSARNIGLAEKTLQPQGTTKSTFMSKLDELYGRVATNLKLFSTDSYANADVIAKIMGDFWVSLNLRLIESNVEDPLPSLNTLWNNLFNLIKNSPHKSSLIICLFKKIQYKLIASYPNSRLIAESFLDSLLKQILTNNDFNIFDSPIMRDFVLGNYEQVENYFAIATEDEKEEYAALFFTATYMNKITEINYARMEIEAISDHLLCYPSYVYLRGVDRQFLALAYIIKGSHKHYEPGYFVNTVRGSEKKEISPIEQVVQLICLTKGQFQEHGIVRVTHTRLYLQALLNPETPHPTAPTPSTSTKLQQGVVTNPISPGILPVGVTSTNELTSALSFRYAGYLALNTPLVIKGLTLVGNKFVSDLRTLLEKVTDPALFRSFWKEIAQHLEQKLRGVQTDYTKIKNDLAYQIAFIEAAAFKSYHYNPTKVHFTYLLSFIEEFGSKFMTHFYADVPSEILQAFWKEDWAEASCLCQKTTTITTFQMGVIAEQMKRRKTSFSEEEMDSILKLFPFSNTLDQDTRSRLIQVLSPFTKYKENLGKGTQKLIHDRFEIFTCYRESIQKTLCERKVFLHPILYPEYIRRIIRCDLQNTISREGQILLSHFLSIHEKRKLEDQQPSTSNKRHQQPSHS